uniref:Uncharacterized protein n=1 Tax=Ixodes ricinus TaxID=34613 RepID=A0A6B0U1S2_IXORI
MITEPINRYYYLMVGHSTWILLFAIFMGLYVLIRAAVKFRKRMVSSRESGFENEIISAHHIFRCYLLTAQLLRSSLVPHFGYWTSWLEVGP